MTGAIALLSGGLDSTLAVALILEQHRRWICRDQPEHFHPFVPAVD